MVNGSELPEVICWDVPSISFKFARSSRKFRACCPSRSAHPSRNRSAFRDAHSSTSRSVAIDAYLDNGLWVGSVSTLWKASSVSHRVVFKGW